MYVHNYYINVFGLYNFTSYKCNCVFKYLCWPRSVSVSRFLLLLSYLFTGIWVCLRNASCNISHALAESCFCSCVYIFDVFWSGVFKRYSTEHCMVKSFTDAKGNSSAFVFDIIYVKKVTILYFTLFALQLSETWLKYFKVIAISQFLCCFIPTSQIRNCVSHFWMWAVYPVVSYSTFHSCSVPLVMIRLCPCRVLSISGEWKATWKLHC